MTRVATALVSLVFTACATAAESEATPAERQEQQQALTALLRAGVKPSVCGNLGEIRGFSAAMHGWTYYYDVQTERLVSACDHTCYGSYAIENNFCPMCPPPEYRQCSEKGRRHDR